MNGKVAKAIYMFLVLSTWEGVVPREDKSVKFEGVPEIIGLLDIKALAFVQRLGLTELKESQRRLRRENPTCACLICKEVDALIAAHEANTKKAASKREG